ncbi:MAG TPA: NADH-quinone oxidoreductase subunit L [Sphingobacteriaceae bacterium]
MEELLWLIPALPFAGSLILLLVGRKLPKPVIALIGAASVSLSALLTIALGFSFLQSSQSAPVYTQTLWVWFDVAGFAPSITFYLDALSLVFVFVITFIGALIHIYSIEFMQADRDYARFFASMNLFVTSMLILVLADNLLLLYLGWEGVGLCSYLLIGFWYENPVNGYAARKAFIMTRIGDTAMAIGLFILFYQFGTLIIPDITANVSSTWTEGSKVATITALLLLAGGIGKSAQLPLQTWLPDAMAGPSPVSALIHAATMVTAGVYLIARMHAVFESSPPVQTIVAIIGAVTLFIAGCSALAQSDIKRVLAYSTISQIGYMFLALGVGARASAIFHFMTHAFFKALLFLAAGAIIEALHHEHSMFKMGGLRKKLPLIFWTFLIGSASLAALPLITSGFYSKDQILWYAWSAEKGNGLFWGIALLGAFITALYTTRMMLLTFWGEPKTSIGHYPGHLMTVPLVILAVFALLIGFIELPHNFGHFALFSGFVEQVLPQTLLREEFNEWLFQGIAMVATLLGVFVGYLLYYRRITAIENFRQTAFAASLNRFWLSGWGFDRLYDLIFVRPVVYLARVNKNDLIDRFYVGIAKVNSKLHRLLSSTQTGSLRWYAMGLLIGSIIIFGIQLLV